MHALVIEDDVMTATLIEEELHELGYHSVDIATSEQEAIAAVARHCPDLITSDGRLSAGCGITAIKKIRASLSIPVIIITGDAQGAREQLPGTPVLEKPFTVHQLVGAVRELWSGRPHRGSMAFADG